MYCLLVLLAALRWTDALKCFSCASSEYRVLLERTDAFKRNARTPHFDQFCDSTESVQAVAPVESCGSTCITIYEPHYFGGLQSIHRPFLIIRGCADRIFESMASRPREVDFLHRASICVSLQLSQIYPQVTANEVVEVCSCTENGCNYRTSANGSVRWRLPVPILLIALYLFY